MRRTAIVFAEVWVVDHDGRFMTEPVPRMATCGWLMIGVEQRATATGVGQRERAAGQVVRTDLVGAGPLGDVGDLRASPEIDRSPASLITGVSRPFSVRPRCGFSWSK